MLPFFHEFVVVSEDCDVQLEFHSCISQVFNLLTTIVQAEEDITNLSVHPNMTESVLITAFGFCHIGKDVERLYAEADKNAFLSAFGESVEDQMTRVSVRSSVLDLV